MSVEHNATWGVKMQPDLTLILITPTQKGVSALPRTSAWQTDMLRNILAELHPATRFILKL